jgi:hypothetical protein
LLNETILLISKFLYNPLIFNIRPIPVLQHGHFSTGLEDQVLSLEAHLFLSWFSSFLTLYGNGHDPLCYSKHKPLLLGATPNQLGVFAWKSIL